jgi:tetratricopeptide (TPR) repeat protein
MLKNPKIAQPKKEKLISSLILTIEKTIDMLQDFIEMERYKKTKFLKNEKINLKELIEEIINELEIDIERKKINVYLNLYEAEFIKTNKDWLKKALLNIIHNSIKYNIKRGDLFITVHREKGGYLLSIKDTGIGMEDEEVKKIFKKYYTSGKDHGTGIGLNMSKTVIESIGGSIVSVNSEKDKGTEFFIFLPKTSKNVKIRQLAAALSGFLILTFLSLDYIYCLIPQKIQKTISDNVIIYKLENNVVARTDKHDMIEIIAYKNLFNTKTRTKLILKKSDTYINTASNPIEVIANGKEIKNHGTEFETVTDSQTFATSVYKGQISTGKTLISQNEGIVNKQDHLIKEKLPTGVTDISIYEDKDYNTHITWDSPYKKFIITLAKDSRFSKAPVKKYTTSKRKIILDTLNDGRWFVSIQSEKDSLFSLPNVKTFLTLRNYEKAKQAFSGGDFTLANTLVDLSLNTVKNDSYKPYLLKSKLLLKSGDLKESLKYAKKADEINSNDDTKYMLGLIYYKLKRYNESIKELKEIKQKPYDLLAYDYFNKKDYAQAKKYLYKTLEKNPENKKALKMMIKIQKLENNKFLLKYFQNQLKEIE